jgi:hypothetical protein
MHDATRGTNEPIRRETKAPPNARDSATITTAEVALRQFLDASREGSDTRDSLTALTRCGDESGEAYFPTTLLAGYSLLPSDIHGDTVASRAAVVTVAEQDVDRLTSRFNARQRVREDVLEWDVIPSDDGQHWAVCNGSALDNSVQTASPPGAPQARVTAASAHSWIR